ncbi:hypothetical protein K431DRAFT_288057 [Polychaeton citri CBS 116435]|uniref:Uncharacterized protein n=1 Tax=Polychaeton citri CBS 116435 TaxID=1314669 RepID=A0A9P4Q4J6_9PEZI|nr:hypothetical protein K431DRAFT_288057 [Polychaeton citri CBS 116435]
MYLFTAGRLVPRAAITRPLAATIRPLHQSAFLRARKDSQDKDSMVVEPNEVSKSASDSAAAAATEDTAFSPNETRPEEQHSKAGKEAANQGQENNPLDVSPANHDVSQPRHPQEGGAEGSPSETGEGSQKSSSSGGGSAPKGGKSKFAGK